MTPTRRGAIAVALGALTAGQTARAQTGALPTAGSRVDVLAAKAVSDRLTPALALAVMRRGVFLHSRGYGLANLETGAPAGAETVFRIGSLTKQFTAAAILLLAQDGRLSLEDKLDRFLPDFPHAGDVTLREMLNHTSGLGNYTQTPTIEAFLQASRTDHSTAEMIEVLKASHPLYLFEPGTGWAYSNTGYVLLGIVVEKASGQPYAGFLRDRVWAPPA